MKIFCQECGSKHEYAALSQKPKFCQECGNRFGGAVVAKAQPVQRVAVVEEEEEEDSIEVPQNVKIRVDLEQDRGITLASLIGTYKNPVEKIYRPAVSDSVIQRAKTKMNRTPIEVG